MRTIGQGGMLLFLFAGFFLPLAQAQPQASPAGTIPSSQNAGENAKANKPNDAGEGNRGENEGGDERLEAYFLGLYQRMPADSPARYALNMIADRNSWRSLSILRGQISANDAERQSARDHLEKLKADIERGLAWPIAQPPTCRIPQTRQAPAIDGELDDESWKSALIFSDEYRLDTTEKMGTGAWWAATWDERYLYFGLWMPQTDIRCLATDIPAKQGSWQADAVEMFVLPNPVLRAYWEVIVNPQGETFDGLQLNNRYGRFLGHVEQDMKGFITAVKVYGTINDSSDVDQGFAIEAAIPFDQLPNYQLGNSPVAGQTLSFMLVRTRTERRYSTPVPFLYDGHNIFGYLRATLSPPSSPSSLTATP